MKRFTQEIDACTNKIVETLMELEKSYDSAVICTSLSIVLSMSAANLLDEEDYEPFFETIKKDVQMYKKKLVEAKK